ncbi:MAG: amino acid permease [Synergistaceae bacterium]|jgi:amino acid permease|nr:amino acid permease [Synergistaceae bacterium]
MTEVKVVNHGFEESALKLEPLTFWEGVAMIIGTDIGSGVLALAYGARNAGWPILTFWLIITAIFTTVSMFYTVETTLRTNKPLQISGLAEKYLGQGGSWLLFAAVAVNSVGCLIAYTTGSGRILSSFLGLPPIIGSLIFFVPSTIVVWLGLRATGRAEKGITVCMGVMMVVLIGASLLSENFSTANLTSYNWYYGIPVFNLTIFAYISQYLVPELTRGFAASGKIHTMPRSIMTGRIFSFLLFAGIPMAAIGLQGKENVSQVVTIAWGEALGQWAFLTANLFALCAMITSFWTIGETLLTNIVDRLKFPDEHNSKYRIIALCLVIIPPFALAYSGMVGFVDALFYSGSFAGVVMSILPIPMLKRARIMGDREPEWTCGSCFHPFMQTMIVILFGGAALYAILQTLGYLPAGW